MYRQLRLILIGVTFCFLGTFSFIESLSTSKRKPSKSLIIKAIEQICKEVPGIFGISALHLERNQALEFNAHKRFPMASTYKVPIGAYCLSLLDKGVINKQLKVKITPRTMRRYCFVAPGQILPLKKLIKLMLERSDNATADIILKLVGGGRAVTRWLQTKGFRGIRIDRPTLKLCADYSGICLPGDEYNCTVRNYNQLLRGVGKKQSMLAAKKFYTDARDTTTPHKMVEFLARLYQGKLISKSSTNFLLQSMLNCTRGQRRIVHLLPKGTKVWHKTGTMDGIVSDIGIIELPKTKGHLVLAIYTNKSVTHLRKKESIIARISKKLFDYFSQSI